MRVTCHMRVIVPPLELILHSFHWLYPHGFLTHLYPHACLTRRVPVPIPVKTPTTLSAGTGFGRVGVGVGLE